MVVVATKTKEAATASGATIPVVVAVVFGCFVASVSPW